MYMSFSILASTGARFFVSDALNIPKQLAVAYNLLDMLISGIATKIFMFRDPSKSGDESLRTLLAVRVVSVLTATALIRIFVGPFRLITAVALNVASLSLGWFVKYATLDGEPESLMPVFV
jgi:hypothetical protein